MGYSWMVNSAQGLIPGRYNGKIPLQVTKAEVGEEEGAGYRGHHFSHLSTVSKT